VYAQELDRVEPQEMVGDPYRDLQLEHDAAVKTEGRD